MAGLAGLNDVVVVWVGLAALLTLTSLRGCWVALRALWAYQASAPTPEGDELRLIVVGNAVRAVAWVGIGAAYVVLGWPRLYASPSNWTPGTITLVASLAAMVALSVMDQAIRTRVVTLSRRALALQADVQASRIEGAIKENTDLTKEAVHKADAAYKEANSVNLKIADLNKRLLEETRGRKDAIEGDRAQVDHIQETTDATHGIVSRQGDEP